MWELIKKLGRGIGGALASTANFAAKLIRKSDTTTSINPHHAFPSETEQHSSENKSSDPEDEKTIFAEIPLTIAENPLSTEILQQDDDKASPTEIPQPLEQHSHESKTAIPEEEFIILPGSLVYGTREARRYKVLTNSKVKLPDVIPTIDLINEQTRYRPYLDPYPRPCHPMGYMYKLLEDEKNKEFIDLDKQDTLTRLVYIHHFEATRFEAQEDRLNANDYVSSFTEKDKAHAEEDPDTTYNSFINKRCKIGILTTLQSGNAVHVLIDILDEKNKPIPDSFLKFFNKDQFKYSSSEIRFIYRNWDDLEYYFRNGQFKFWTVAIDCELGLRPLKEPPWANPSTKAAIEETYKPSRKKDILYGRFWMEDRIRREICSTLPEFNRYQYAFRQMPSVIIAQYAVEYAPGFEAEPKEVKHQYVSKIKRRLINAGFGVFSPEESKERKFEVLDRLINSPKTKDLNISDEGKEILKNFRAGKLDCFTLIDEFAKQRLRFDFYYLVKAAEKDSVFCREILPNTDMLLFAIEKFRDEESNLRDAYNKAHPIETPRI